jgi:predicted AAA+ superfamily ATPase
VANENNELIKMIETQVGVITVAEDSKGDPVQWV